MFDFNDLKSFDWRSLQKYGSPQAFDDLNAFLEKLPNNVGGNLLIVAGVIWAFAAALGLYTTVQVQNLTKLRAELQEAQALKPVVPVVQNVSVSADEVKRFAEKSKNIYRNVDIKASGAVIVLSAESTAFFGQFREAIGHVQNGGSGWRVSVDNLCVGRECKGSPLKASLKINKVSVNKPG